MKIKTKDNFIFFAALIITSLMYGGFASAYQICQPSEDCTLGEFVYDDDYDEVTKNVCEITITDPQGNILVDDEDTTYGSEDGWHSYVFNTSGPEGLYRSAMCCKEHDEEVCVDKTFILKNDSTSLSSISDIVTKDDLDSFKREIISGVKGTSQSGDSELGSEDTVYSMQISNEPAERDASLPEESKMESESSLYLKLGVLALAAIMVVAIWMMVSRKKNYE